MTKVSKVEMGMGKKIGISITMALILAISLVLPAFATNNEATTSDADQSATVQSNITAPLPFDGSKTDDSEVQVHNAVPEYSTESTDTPTAITTTMKNDNGGSLSLITASNYFYTTNSTVKNGAWYIAEFQDLYSNSGYTAYYARIGITSGVKTSSENAVTLTVQQYANCGFISGDISPLVSAGSASLYIALFDASGSLLYYTDAPISTSFVKAGATVNSGKYLYSGELQANLSLKIPEDLSDTSNLDIELLDSNGTMAAKSLRNYSSISSYTSQYSETRFYNVFGSYVYDCQYYESQLNAWIYFAHIPSAGTYDVKITDGSTVYTYKGLITVVNAPVVNNFGYISGNGFAPPVYGGNTAYAEVYAKGAGINDFTVTILNGNGDTVGSAVSEKYYYDSIYYKLALTSGTFVNTEKYTLKLTYKGTGDIYYSPETETELYVSNYFSVYNVAFNSEGNLADFTLSAVNPPTGTLTLGLFKSSDMQTPISTATVTAGSMMTVRFNDGTSSSPLSLDDGSYYIQMEQSYTGGTYWMYLGYVYVNYTSSSSDESSGYYNTGESSYLTTDTSFNFSVTLIKSALGLATGSTYSAVLCDYKGKQVGTQSGAMSAENTTFTDSSGDSSDAVCLTGSVSLDSGAKIEGSYILVVTALTGTVKSTADFYISCLDPSKNYAEDCYPWLTSTCVTSYLYSPKISSLSADKLSFVIKSLDGNTLYTLKPSVSKDYEMEWNLSAAIPRVLNAGYYSVELQYDGKSLYNYSNPTDLLQSGYSLYKDIAAHPELRYYEINSARECFGFNIDKGSATSLSVTAKVYDSSDNSNFTPAASISMNLDPSTGLYEIDDLSGIVSGEKYDVVLLDENGISIGYLTDVILGSKSDEKVAVTGVSLGDSSINLSVGDTYQLSKSIAPSGATDKKVTWCSDKPGIATVDANGLVTGVTKGTAVIKVTTEDGSKTATCTVTVNDTVAVKSVSLDNTALSMNVGNTATLHATIAPSGATNNTVSWTSSNTTVAKVDTSTGVVTAMGAGSTIITATTEDGNKKATCEVTVGVPVTGTLTCGSIGAKDVWIKLESASGTSGTNIATSTDLTPYSSYSESVCTDQNGYFSFSAVPVGTYTLTAMSNEPGYKAILNTLTVSAGDTQEALGTLAFASKYSKNCSLEVDVSGGSDWTAWISGTNINYQATETAQSGTNSVTFANVPYSNTGTQYEVCMYDKDSGYYDSQSVSVSTSSASVYFTVPTSYSISGKVNCPSGAIWDSFIIATDSKGGQHYGNIESSGNYKIGGLQSGTYTVSLMEGGGYTAKSKTVTIDAASVNLDLDATAGVTLKGLVMSTDNSTPYRAFVSLYKDDTYVAGSSAIGNGEFVLDKAITAEGNYTLKVSDVYNNDCTSVQFTGGTVDFTVGASDFSNGYISKVITYDEFKDASSAFTGNGNAVVSNMSVVHDGSSPTLAVKYKNNSSVAISSATFALDLPTGFTATIPGSDTFTVTNLAAGANGEKLITLNVGSVTNNYISIPVSVTVGASTYAFGSASLEYANITLKGPEAATSGTSFKVYGEATDGSSVAIKNADTGEVLAAAVTSGRWYSADINFQNAGKYRIYAEATVSNVKAVSDILNVDVRSDQISVASVMANGMALSINKKLGVYTYSTYASPNLVGNDIPISTAFTNGSSISTVTYHFGGMDYQATNAGGAWTAVLSGWSGAGSKTITVTVKTSDGRTIDFVLCEVTVLIDPSGVVKDSETGSPVEGATVTLYVLKDGDWEAYDSSLYDNEANPQTTDAYGRYGWNVPSGTYMVVANKIGYVSYSTLSDSNFSTGGTSTILIPPARDDINFSLTPSVPVTSLSLSQAALPIAVGGSKKITATASPLAALNANNIVWNTSDVTVATVSGGKITAVGVGTATITASVGIVTAKCSVEVVSSGTVVTVNVSGKSVTFNTTVAEASGAVAAVYDASGKLIGIGSTSITEKQGSASISVSVSSLPSGSTLKLIMLDSSYKPASEYYCNNLN